MGSEAHSSEWCRPASSVGVRISKLNGTFEDTETQEGMAKGVSPSWGGRL